MAKSGPRPPRLPAPCQATSISPWVVTPAALEPFAVPAPPQDDPLPPPYLHQPDGRRTNYDVQLEVSVLPETQSARGDGGHAVEAAEGAAGAGGAVATRSSMRTMYWTLPQVGGSCMGCWQMLAGPWLCSLQASIPWGPC